MQVSGRRYTASRMPHETPLAFYVRHSTSETSGWSPLSRPSNPISTPLGAPPAKPTGLRLGALKPGVAALSCSHLALTWQRSAGCPVDDHRLQIRSAASDSWTSTSARLSGTSTNASGFDGAELGPICRASSTLEMRLQAKSAAGWSTYSAILSATLGASRPPTHAAPPRVASPASCDAVTLAWSAADAHGTPVEAHRWVRVMGLQGYCRVDSLVGLAVGSKLA